MSSSSGIALVTRKTSATLIVSSWPLAGAWAAAWATAICVSSSAISSGLVLLRLDEEEVADGRHHEQHRDDEDGDRDVALHEAVPSGARVATIEKE
jgi:hypothetical protein